MPRGRSKRRLRSAPTMATHVRTSATYLQQGHVDQAEEALRRALTIDADLPQANNTWALRRSRRRSGAGREVFPRGAARPAGPCRGSEQSRHPAGGPRLSGGGVHFEKAIRSAPAYVEARHGYGLVLALMQSYTRAVAELETAVRLAPDRAPARVDLADVLATLGRLDEARREYTGAIRLDPANREARAAWRRCVVKAGNQANFWLTLPLQIIDYLAPLYDTSRVSGFRRSRLEGACSPASPFRSGWFSLSRRS